MQLPATVTINEVKYSLEKLSEAAKTQVVNLLITQQHIERLEQEMAIARTAQIAYQNAFIAAATVDSAATEKKKVTRVRKAKFTE